MISDGVGVNIPPIFFFNFYFYNSLISEFFSVKVSSKDSIKSAINDSSSEVESLVGKA